MPVLPARSPLRPPPPPKHGSGVVTKRQHALQELLASEKSYGSDLALVRQVHIPLALGASVPIHVAGQTLTSEVDAPMTSDDVRLIFGNIADLADFASRFQDALQAALDADTVGALFVRSVAEMEGPYKTYIARHEAAARHLRSLTATPALTAYHSQTQTIASAMSRAWDLHSLLIKPVQRLLKYPLLLATIYDETPATHPDKHDLRRARDAVQDLAFRVNEERHRAEVVKDVLKRNIVRLKSVKGPPPPSDMSNYHARLLRVQSFSNQLAQNVLHWSRSVAAASTQLHAFAKSFGNVIGISTDVQSDSFDAFMTLITMHLIPLTTSLSQTLSTDLLTPLSQLLDATAKPLHLVETLQNTLLPLHTRLMDMPVSHKNRPSPDLIKASADYVALRGKLAEELPIFADKADRVLCGCVFRLARAEQDYWKQVNAGWRELWDMLSVEPGNTIKVWWDRWEEVDAVLSRMQCVQFRAPSPSSASSSLSNATTAVGSVLSSLDPKRSFKSKTRSEFEYDMYEYKTRALDSLRPKLRRPSTSMPSLPRRKSFRRKLSDPHVGEEALYTVRSVYPFDPPKKKYFYDSFPFLALDGQGEELEVLKEAGHPKDHLSRGLMLHVDDRDAEEPDSLLLVRRKLAGEVGWALASYLQPLTI
ncbi:Dbl homology domain-containing protein [Armillaria novae-zelandiae]|uniref:Dbl homology domain-containing protein n=1 Tax=Armillaria novae-zelandiae TaxID=153914 RepID=A0AA39ULH3_9AGAR|nr:Dbl homology domain-containing protein [Armillaria novae-zelandiae]